MDNRQKLQQMLDLTCAMWDDPLVFHYQSLEFAPKGIISLFLAGPSSRQDVLKYKWRALAVHYLRLAGYKGVIYVPEPCENDWSFKENFPMEIVDWEIERLMSSTMKFFWVPRHEVQLPGRVTNTELGFWLGRAYENLKIKDQIVWGYPTDAWKMKSEHHWARLPGIEPFHDLEAMCKHVAERLESL